MKVSFIALSILSSMLTWWWISQPRRQQRTTRQGRVRRLAQSMIAGVVVYFSLMAIAMMWLLVTT